MYASCEKVEAGPSRASPREITAAVSFAVDVTGAKRFLVAPAAIPRGHAPSKSHCPPAGSAGGWSRTNKTGDDSAGTEVQQGRALVLSQVIDPRLQDQVGIVAVGKGHRGALTLLIEHALERPGNTGRFVVISARQHALLVDGQLDHALRIADILSRVGEGPQRKPFRIADLLRLWDRGDERLELLGVLLRRPRWLAIDVHGVLLVVDIAAGAVGVVHGLRVRPRAPHERAECNVRRGCPAVVGAAVRPPAIIRVPADRLHRGSWGNDTRSSSGFPR